MSFVKDISYVLWIILPIAWFIGRSFIKKFLRTLEKDQPSVWESLGKPKITLLGVRPKDRYISYMQKRAYQGSGSEVVALAGKRAHTYGIALGLILLIGAIFYIGYFYSLSSAK